MKIDQMRLQLPLCCLLLLFLWTCTSNNHLTSSSELYLTQDIPLDIPKPFLPVGPQDGFITHQGVFSPDYGNYYFTVSDPGFSQFTVKQITKEGTRWSAPRDAFFNSNFNEHGMSFSQDGNTLFFSSTRPVPNQEVADTWHLWKVKRLAGKWGEPVYVDIPNLRHQLISHPSVALDGTLYFHSSKPDYSEMSVYSSELSTNGQYLPAQKLELPGLGEKQQACTPYIDPKERYILLALIGKELELALSRKTGSGEWGIVQKFPSLVNTNGQGNPQVSPDGKYLFYAVGDFEKGEGVINWIELATVW